MPTNLGNVSVLNINGNELTIKDAVLTEIVNEIIEAIGANNTSISERINDLHSRSFDAEIKISSANESEISNIIDRLYKLQYVTITGEGDNATETLDNSAILIQKSNNQYLIKDGQISSRTKTDNVWSTWISAITNELGTLTTQISTKIPKVSNSTPDNFASFNSDGTIKDSGHSHSDYITSIKTINNESLTGTGNIVISGLPQVSTTDNGKILIVVNGQWQLVSPSVLYTGQGVPNNAQGNNGDLYMQTD